MSKTNSLPCLFTFQEHDTSKSSISDLHAVLGCTGVVVRTNYMQNIGTHACHGIYYDADHDYAVSNAHAIYKLTRIAGNFNNCCDGDILLLISSKVLLFCCVLVGADLIRLLYMRRWDRIKLLIPTNSITSMGIVLAPWPGRIQMLGRQGWRKRPELSFPRYTQLTTLPEL